MEKIILPTEAKQKLYLLAEQIGLYLEGNIVKVIDPEGDEAFKAYLLEATAKDHNQRSKRLKITKQIQEQNKSLTHLTDQLKITIVDLEEARKNAEEALKRSDRQNEGIVQLSWMLSHNLRGPVASLLGIINLLSRDGSLTTSTAAMAGLLKDTAGKIDSKIKEISEVLETHILKPEEVSTFRLDEMIMAIYEECARDAAGDPVEFICDVPEGLEIRFPANSMKKILRSLLENALTFRRPDNLHQIHVTWHIANYENRLSVTDNGIGIEESLFAKIFEPFKICSEKSSGRGMGLYVAKSLMDGVNGMIGVESTVGQGTTFTITIPRL